MAILADLVSRFSSRPEPVATEALNLILGRSQPVRIAFARFCDQFGITIPREVRFQAEVWFDQDGRPDLVGYVNSSISIIVEAKFNAALTENQPLRYLDRFTCTKPGLFLFIVPERRREVLWGEMRESCCRAFCH